MIHIYARLQENVIVSIAHLRTGEKKDQEMCLAPSANKKSQKYDSKYLNNYNYNKAM